MVANVLEVNPERLWDSLERSAEIGRFRDVGLRRLALSAEDKEMRDLFVEWAKAAGCTRRDRSAGQHLRAAAGHRSVAAAGRHRQSSRHADLRRPLRRHPGRAVRPGDRAHAERPWPADQARHRGHLLDQRGRRALQPADDGIDGLRQGDHPGKRAGHHRRCRHHGRAGARRDRLCRPRAGGPRLRFLSRTAHRAGAGAGPRGLRRRHRGRRLQDPGAAAHDQRRHRPCRRHADGACGATRWSAPAMSSRRSTISALPMPPTRAAPRRHASKAFPTWPAPMPSRSSSPSTSATSMPTASRRCAPRSMPRSPPRRRRPMSRSRSPKAGAGAASCLRPNASSS